MNGGQAIGYINAKNIADADDSPAPTTYRDYESTAYIEQLMRCLALTEDRQAYKWHAVSPGEGMGFLQTLDKIEKNIIA